ncbi:MAG TPA: hypothetical protein VGK99_18490 [Acidobacteriota bacterium]|jgi:hypothetical protein
MSERWTLGVRILSHQIDRATWRNTLTYRITRRLQIGVEYNPLAPDVRSLVNAHLLTETKNRPALIFGTSSDRIGTPSGQSFYLTLSKDLRDWTGLRIAPYAGVAYGTFEDRARPIGGINLRFTRRTSALVIFDGVRVHPTLNYQTGRHVLSLVLVKGKDPGASYSIAF